LGGAEGGGRDVFCRCFSFTSSLSDAFDRQQTPTRRPTRRSLRGVRISLVGLLLTTNGAVDAPQGQLRPACQLVVRGLSLAQRLFAQASLVRALPPTEGPGKASFFLFVAGKTNNVLVLVLDTRPSRRPYDCTVHVPFSRQSAKLYSAPTRCAFCSTNEAACVCVCVSLVSKTAASRLPE
jgi:hypothetical protein